MALFAQNKELPPYYAVNRKPVSYAVARALQTTGLLLYFWGQAKKSYLLGFQSVQMELGFRCYSKKVSLGKKVFAREEFRFSPLTEEREPHRTAMTRPSKRKVYLRQISKLGGRPPKRGCRLQCASGRVLSDVQQSPALTARMNLSIRQRLEAVA